MAEIDVEFIELMNSVLLRESVYVRGGDYQECRTDTNHTVYYGWFTWSIRKKDFAQNSERLQKLLQKEYDKNPYTSKFYIDASSDKDTRSIPNAVKTQVWQRDNGQCAECGSKLFLEFDHSYQQLSSVFLLVQTRRLQLVVD
jgi:hypothetical protein